MIPVVDFTPYCLENKREEADPEQIKSLANQICNAFTDVGFVYLKHHGIPKSKVDGIFSLSKEFFQKPVEIKEKYAKSSHHDVMNNRGWVALEKELLNPERPADPKEAFNYQLIDDKETLPNDILPSFQGVYSDFYKHCQELVCRVLDLMSMGLNIDTDYFRKCHSLIGKEGNPTTLRSLYYPPLNNGVKPGQIRCGEHTDYGTVTLLFQDEIGGLEVKPAGSDYIPARPIPDTVLVNLGDKMQRWTADKLVATKHRVLIPEEEIKKNQGRQSFAFFVHPDDHVMIECLDNSNKYEPVSSKHYLNMRFAATYL
ncbi:hypothetical protein FSP39_014681 [Pinctada imbricata]|uniref:Fe2OG dioxygenase domain-containing protein n=1 Tax=Pinctada imbricata TaxID=66713 RepID=A0AA89CAU7_PINIB|nr:hypothetical protein FSP39_014681 [Pinctada imbricata]